MLLIGSQDVYKRQSRHGEGVSGIRLEITKDGKLLNAFVGGKPLKDDQLYTVPEVKAAIEECRGAGIRPIMITGDHKDTAVAIALELGLSLIHI